MVNQFKPKIIFFDIDDTLYIKQHDDVPSSVFTALAQLKQQGVLLAIATGRAISIFPQSIQQLINQIGIDIIVSINGQYVSFHGERLAHFPLAQDMIDHVVDYFKQHRIAYGLMSDQEIYISSVTPEVEQAMNSLHLSFGHLDQRIQSEHIYQILAFYTEQQHQVQLGSQFKVVRWHSSAVDILNSDTSKVKGIQYVLDRLGIHWEETVAFGDGCNDIEMLKAVGLGIAMGNAELQLQQVADYITETHEQDGILKALQYFKMI